VGNEVRFTARVTADGRKRVLVPVAVDPDDAWGPKLEHHVAGTVNGMGVRAVIEPLGSGRGILLGPAWRRHCGIGPGDEVEVVLYPEGPQRANLARRTSQLRWTRRQTPQPSLTRWRSSTGAATFAGLTPPSAAPRSAPPGSRK
jgi:hypothetical protein